jgi:hypothetical protein
MARTPDQPHPEFTPVNVGGLLRCGCWASLPNATIESLIAGGRVIDFPAGHTVYTEADNERLAVLLLGLLRVYMHASDGRQVTVRYVRVGDLLGGRSRRVGSSTVRRPRRARGKRVRVGPAACRTPSSRSRGLAPGSERPTDGAGQSAGSREQCGLGTRSGRARPRGATGGRNRSNVAGPRGDARSGSHEPPALVPRG